jgi:hypothetical protein
MNTTVNLTGWLGLAVPWPFYVQDMYHWRCGFTPLIGKVLGILKNPRNFRIGAANTLKVPKHKIFDGVFFASKEHIWSSDS